MNKKTLVMGASPNPARYSYLATRLLHQHGHIVVPFGPRKGYIDSLEITPLLPEVSDIDTVTLYLNPQNQIPYVDYILKLKPNRVIFNPGTENPEFQSRLQAEGIEPLEACTLVLLQTGQY